MQIYLFDEQTSFFAGESEAAPGDVPESWVYPLNATTTAPPSVIPASKVARWNGSTWELVDPPTQTEKRRAAYAREADPLFLEAQHYQAEAEGFRLLEQFSEAEAAEEKGREFLKRYAEKKAEIRARYPDAGPDLYRLNATGTYHESSCSYASGDGADLSLEDIRIVNPAARPCSRCNPPPLDGEAAGG